LKEDNEECWKNKFKLRLFLLAEKGFLCVTKDETSQSKIFLHKRQLNCHSFLLINWHV